MLDLELSLSPFLFMKIVAGIIAFFTVTYQVTRGRKNTTTDCIHIRQLLTFPSNMTVILKVKLRGGSVGSALVNLSPFLVSFGSAYTWCSYSEAALQKFPRISVRNYNHELLLSFGYFIFNIIN